MRHAYQNSILITFGLFVLFGFGAVAHAQNIEVDFEQTPLFTDANLLLPGDTITRTFTVENTSGAPQDVRLRTYNESNTGLADVLSIVVGRTASTTYFSDTLSELFTRDYIELGTLDTGATAEFYMTATLLASAGNEHQNGTAGFDLCVGFAGNENCVTDTTPIDNGGGSSSGGGGGGGSNNNDDEEEDENDDLPPGLIAGASTSTPWGTFVDAVGTAGDVVRGMIAGASASAQGTTTTTSGGEVERDDPNAVTSTAAEIVWGESLCTFWWLLLLAVISLSWSWYDDTRRFNLPRLFRANMIFGGVYLAALLGFFFFGVLDQLWWVFAGSWAAMAIVDYRAHLKIQDWSPTERNWYYSAASFLFIATSFFFGFPCVWWPFFGLLVISGIVFILQDED